MQKVFGEEGDPYVYILEDGKLSTRGPDGRVIPLEDESFDIVKGRIQSGRLKETSRTPTARVERPRTVTGAMAPPEHVAAVEPPAASAEKFVPMGPPDVRTPMKKNVDSVMSKVEKIPGFGDAVKFGGGLDARIKEVAASKFPPES